MGRVLDVSACLCRMRAESGETLTLRITDEACPKNTGIYLLRFTDGETTVEKRCDGDVDASLTINAFRCSRLRALLMPSWIMLTG